jgi:hypothetical protein
MRSATASTALGKTGDCSHLPVIPHLGAVSVVAQHVAYAPARAVQAAYTNFMCICPRNGHLSRHSHTLDHLLPTPRKLRPHRPRKHPHSIQARQHRWLQERGQSQRAYQQSSHPSLRTSHRSCHSRTHGPGAAIPANCKTAHTMFRSAREVVKTTCKPAGLPPRLGKPHLVVHHSHTLDHPLPPPRSTAHPLRNHPTQCLSMSTPATGCPAACEGREAHAHATRAGSPPSNKHQPRAREVKGAAGLLHPECNWLCTRFCGLHERRQVGASHACWGFRGQKPGWCLARQTQKLRQGCTECGVPGTSRDGWGCSISKQLMLKQSRCQQPRIVHAHLSHKQGKALPQRRLRAGFAAQHGRTAWHTKRGGQCCAWAGRWGLPRWGWYHSMPRPPQHQQASSDSHTQRGVDSTAQAQAAGACQEGEEYQTTRRFTTGMGRGGVGSTMDMHATGGVVGGGMATMPQSLQPQKHEGWAIPRHGACHNGLQEVG